MSEFSRVSMLIDINQLKNKNKILNEKKGCDFLMVKKDTKKYYLLLKMTPFIVMV